MVTMTRQDPFVPLTAPAAPRRGARRQPHPFARSDGPYATASNQDLLTAALNGLVERYGLGGERVGAFVAGAVLKHSRDFNLARETVLGSALDPRTPAYDIQQACGTGLQAVIAAANQIALGSVDSAIAGGSDTTSDAPSASTTTCAASCSRPAARRRRAPASQR